MYKGQVFLSSGYQNFDFQISNFKFSITIQLCRVLTYCGKKRRFSILIIGLKKLNSVAAIGVLIQLLNSNIHKHLLVALFKYNGKY